MSTAGYVKLLLPPRQSRGNSHWGLAWASQNGLHGPLQFFPDFARSARLVWLTQQDRGGDHDSGSYSRTLLGAPASYSGITCSSGSGLIEISPVKGRSCASISNIDAATPVAKIPIAIPEASLLSLWTMAIATRAQSACMNRHDHLSR